MLLKTKFSQLATWEQYTVLWSSVTFYMFLKSWQDKVFFPWILKFKLSSSSSRLFCLKIGLPERRSHVKSAWEVSVENTEMECPWGWRWHWLSEGSRFCFRGPRWGSQHQARPGHTEMAGRRTVQWVPLNHATKKRCNEKQVPVHS